MTKILIMGLPGSGKTTLATEMVKCFQIWNKSYLWLNADAIRTAYNDWDFSHEGRLRQAHRMRDLADSSNAEYILADFVAPLEEMRDIFKPDFVIWMDTIEAGRYEDTNACFQKPKQYDVRVKTKAAKIVAPQILWKYFS